MNIGDLVEVRLLMEVEGIKRDQFSMEILIEGKVRSQERGNYFIAVPQYTCKNVDQAHAL